jgi:CRISPR/Cas system type I-B associated protein Csh2 (Cas7 group RAMP superfamily)
MIKQTFGVDGYWKVVIFWNLDYHFFDDVELELRMIGFPNVAIEEVKETMLSGEAKAVTCSITHQHTSIVLFNNHTSKADYISSIVHEAEHIKQAILRAYDIEDKGEAPAYTIGYIVKKMYEVFKIII